MKENTEVDVNSDGVDAKMTGKSVPWSKEELRCRRKEKNKKKKLRKAFPVLGKHPNDQKAGKVLPHIREWLANPTIIETDLLDQQMLISAMSGLDVKLVENLRKQGISYFFPVQRTVIPWLLENEMRFFYKPSDICVCSPTGSGKTLAYVLPIIQALSRRVVPMIQALVILPSRELAEQVYNVFKNFCDGTSVKVLFADANGFFQDDQEILVKKGFSGYVSQGDILITTPGRLVDHILQRTPGFTLRHLRFLILDESDRLMNNEVEYLLSHIERAVYFSDSPGVPYREPPGPITVSQCQKMTVPLQKLLFSATLNLNAETLQHLNLFQPKLFTTAGTHVKSGSATSVLPVVVTPDNLHEYLLVSPQQSLKPLIIYHLVKAKHWKHVLVFTNTKEETRHLSVLLKNLGIQAVDFESSNKYRLQKLRRFKNGEVDVLVCTDVASRGLDIDCVEYVISYSMPRLLQSYIHRVGRTARAGRPGTAVTILEGNEVGLFRSKLKPADKENMETEHMDISELQKYEKKYQEALHKTKTYLERKLHKTQVFKKYGKKYSERKILEKARKLKMKKKIRRRQRRQSA